MEPFKLMGCKGPRFYYHVAATGMVISLTAQQHFNYRHMLRLAPLAWWESQYPGPRGCNWKAAASALIHAQYAVGEYREG